MVAATATSVRKPDSLPFPHLPAGTPSMPQIEHIVVLMMENHSFDNLLGMLPRTVPGRKRVDGFTFDRHGNPTNFNRDASGNKIKAAHADSPCQLPKPPKLHADPSLAPGLAACTKAGLTPPLPPYAV